MKEMILAIQAIWECWQNGTRLNFRGDFYTHTLMTPFFNPGPHPHGIGKIYASAVGPLMTRAVAEAADGLLVHPLNTTKYIKEVTLPVVEEGLASAGKKRSDFDLSVNVMTAVGLTEESTQNAINATKQQIAFYASTPNYIAVLETHGVGDLHPELNRLSKQGKWQEMGSLIDDDFLNTVAVVAETPEAAAKEIKARYGEYGDRITPILYSGENELAPAILNALKS